MNTEYLAHISPDGRKQTVEEHLRSVAKLTSEMLSCIGLGSLGYLTGLLHDIGKLTSNFNRYICLAAAGEKVRRGSVNHTFAGVIFLWNRYHDKADPYERLVCELLCCAVGSHHELFDCLSPDGKSGFLHRLKKDRGELYYDEAEKEFLSRCASEEEINSLFSDAVREFKAAIPRIGCFGRSVLERLITSALIDADRTDTAAFMNGEQGSAPSLRSVLPAACISMETIIKNMQAGSNAVESIKKARSVISEECISFAEKPCGIYRLNVPTGAGKTAASFRYALSAALHKGNIRHIFYVAPLLTVLEQNADEIRRFVGDPSWVLEHHSNVVFDENETDELARYELLAERWDFPFIVTTMVQLLNTFFASKTTSIRRMCELCNSILIIDEVQSLPLKTLSLFNGTIDFLAKHCGTTVILCSATQPPLEDRSIRLKLGMIPDMVPFDKALWEPFRRADIIDARVINGLTAPELAALACEKAETYRSVLLICNTRKAAADIYRAVKDTADSSTAVRHLSASMCRMHRKHCLDELIERITTENGGKTICISTQLIEAGVDISFGCVIRTLAGLDSIVQAAGRCNRHGELKRDGNSIRGEVLIVNSRDENTAFLKDIKLAQDACAALLDDFRRCPEAYGSELFGKIAVNTYYSQLYMELNAASSGSTEYRINADGVSTTVYALLSKNEQSAEAADKETRELKAIMQQAFKTAGDAFEVFDESSRQVIVPYNEEAVRIICELSSERCASNMKRVKRLISEAKPYTVSVYDNALRRLENAGAILHCCDDSVLAVSPDISGIYDPETGLSTPQANGEALFM